MRTKSSFYVPILMLLIIIACDSDNNKNAVTKLKGSYLGQNLPGNIPELFAPNIVSDGLNNRDIAMMPDGKELYFTTSVGGTEYVAILYTIIENGIWTKPEVVSFSTDPQYMYYEPCISYDGSKLFFISNMPLNDGTHRSEPNIWYVKRESDNWGEPIALDSLVNSTYDEYFPSITQDGTLYFTRGSASGVYSIYKSRFVDGKYTEAEKLPNEVNSGITRFNAFVARNENYIILSVYGLEDTVGGMDYYIVYRNEEGSWGNPVNLGNLINTQGDDEYSSYVSPDAKYFFFMSKRSIQNKISVELTSNFLHKVNNIPQNGNSDIYWVNTQFIEDLQQN